MELRGWWRRKRALEGNAPWFRVPQWHSGTRPELEQLANGIFVQVLSSSQRWTGLNLKGTTLNGTPQVGGVFAHICNYMNNELIIIILAHLQMRTSKERFTTTGCKLTNIVWSYVHLQIFCSKVVLPLALRFPRAIASSELLKLVSFKEEKNTPDKWRNGVERTLSSWELITHFLQSIRTETAICMLPLLVLQCCAIVNSIEFSTMISAVIWCDCFDSVVWAEWKSQSSATGSIVAHHNVKIFFRS